MDREVFLELLNKCIPDSVRRLLQSIPGEKKMESEILVDLLNEYVPDSIRRQIQSIPGLIASRFRTYVGEIASRSNPYVQLSIAEYCGGRHKRNELFTATGNYLVKISRKPRLVPSDDERSMVFILSDDEEELIDNYGTARLVWSTNKAGDGDGEGRSHVLTFHKSDRSIVLESYLDHVMEVGMEIEKRRRQREFFTNEDSGSGSRSKWSPCVLTTLATFETLAMEPEKKKEIISDLFSFSEACIGKKFRIGNRRYMITGPPGVGKTTLVSAIINFLNEYDVYHLDLSLVNDTEDLRELLNETSSKSIIVLEDLDRTFQPFLEEEEDPFELLNVPGLLNVIDGFSSAFGDKRIIILTTNQVDPALIPIVDKHIQMPHCGFEAFKVLAKNYLRLEDHKLFDKIRGLLEEVEITAADVAQNLMGSDPISCLGRLVDALQKANMKEKWMHRE